MDYGLHRRVRKQSWFHRYPRGWPFLLFLLASIATVVAVMAIERSDSARREVELDRNLTEIAAGLQRRAAENVALLRAAAALFETQPSVTSEQFADFAQDLQPDRALHGSLGIGWARLVHKDRLPFFELELREREGTDFLAYPRPAPNRDVTVPIVYLLPATSYNSRAIGFDMYSEATRRAALDRSIGMGEPVASGKVTLIQDRGQEEVSGFLIFMPVYDNGRRDRVKGFVYSPFRTEQFLDSAAELYSARDVEIAVYDGVEDEANLLARRSAAGTSGIAMSRTISVADREWVIVVREKKSAALTPLSRVTLFFGAIAALLVMAVGWLITGRAVEDHKMLQFLQSQSSIRDSLTRELNHRVKNTLANVLSIAALTRRSATDLDSYAESFTARIKALSATHDLLSQGDWNDALLGDIVQSELAPYMQGETTHAHLSGPEIALAPNDAMSLGLAIHELATNAAKYGALSASGGRIFVEWEMSARDQAEIHWREEGGPTVSEPTRRGFGRDLIEKVVAHELGTEVELRFEPRGVRCTLTVPVRKRSEFALRNEPGATNA